MDKISSQTQQAQQSSYYDFAELDNLRSAKSEDKSALKAAAKQFESIFTQMLLTSMRKASEVLESDSPFNTQSTKFYRDMHDKQLVSSLADSGGLGLAEMIYQQLSGEDPNFRPASVLRSDGGLNAPGQVHDKLPGNTAEKGAETGGVKAQNKPQQKDSLFDSPMSFIESLLPAAKKVVENSPLSPVMLVAQAALETGWGKKVINKSDGSSSFNLFGIKADERWQGDKTRVQTLEFRDGVARKEHASFRAYDSLEDSLRDYLDFIATSDRYREAMKKADDPAQYFESLQSAGYATDPEYAKKVVNILNSDFIKDIKE